MQKNIMNNLPVPAPTPGVSSANAAREAAEREREDAERKLAENRRDVQQRMTEKRTFVRELEAQLTDARASLLRTEAEASRLAIETTNAATEMEVERDGAVASADAEKKRRLAAEAEAARYDDKTLSALVEYLAPKDGPARARADALLKVKSLDALPSSAAAVDAESKRNEHYKRSMRTLLDSLIHHVADGQTDRIGLLESAVAEHLEKRSQGQVRAALAFARNDITSALIRFHLFALSVVPFTFGLVPFTSRSARARAPQHFTTSELLLLLKRMSRTLGAQRNAVMTHYSQRSLCLGLFCRRGTASNTPISSNLSGVRVRVRVCCVFCHRSWVSHVTSKPSSAHRSLSCAATFCQSLRATMCSLSFLGVMIGMGTHVLSVCAFQFTRATRRATLGRR